MSAHAEDDGDIASQSLPVKCFPVSNLYESVASCAGTPLSAAAAARISAPPEAKRLGTNFACASTRNTRHGSLPQMFRPVQEMSALHHTLGMHAEICDPVKSQKRASVIIHPTPGSLRRERT